MLPYRWQIRVKSEQKEQQNQQIEGGVEYTNNEGEQDVDEWKWCSYSESMQYEAQFNNTNNTQLPDKYEIQSNFRRRTVLFFIIHSYFSNTIYFGTTHKMI